MYCGRASRLSGRHRGKHLSVSIINKQLHQIVVIMHPSSLKNGREKIYFFKQHAAGIQTSAKRDPGRARPRAVGISFCPRGFSPQSR